MVVDGAFAMDAKVAVITSNCAALAAVVVVVVLIDDKLDLFVDGFLSTGFLPPTRTISSLLLVAANVHGGSKSTTPSHRESYLQWSILFPSSPW